MMRSRFAVAVIAVMALAFMTVARAENHASWQDDSIPETTGAAVPDGPQPQHHAAMSDALRHLAQEAKRIMERENGKTPPASADFASRFEGELHPLLLTESIARPADRDPFIDAYIRWQLTSFGPALPEFDDRGFLAFMAELPAMVENPRAEPQTVRIFQLAHKADSISRQDFERLKKLATELDIETAAAEVLNQPALGFRDWVATQLGEQGCRPRLWLLERCDATITAGWSTSRVKSQITGSFENGGQDALFTPPQRELVAERARRLIDAERRMIDSIVFTAAGGVEVSFQRAHVDADDVERWIQRLGVPHEQPAGQ